MVKGAAHYNSYICKLLIQKFLFSLLTTIFKPINAVSYFIAITTPLYISYIYKAIRAHLSLNLVSPINGQTMSCKNDI